MKYFLSAAVILLAVCIWTPAFCGEVHDAAKSGDLAKVKEILSKNPELISTQNEDGKTPLHLAAGWGRIEVMKYLISLKVDINIRNKDGGTPLHVAASQGQPEAARLLLKSGADVNAVRTVGKATPLHIAALKGHKDVAVILIENGADVNAKMANGATPLRVALARGNNDIAELIRKAGGK
ncbi:MAG: ankyrin repeat domain-containing protein [Firmicutes bacterium]|nr:ankyrin repeat domain-containing protein [Bacillota bacterium]